MSSWRRLDIWQPIPPPFEPRDRPTRSRPGSSGANAFTRTPEPRSSAAFGAVGARHFSQRSWAPPMTVRSGNHRLRSLATNV
jgi:hypothetical protein